MNTESEIWTVLRLLKWTTDYLKKCDTDSPRLDAEILLADAMKCTRMNLYTRYDYEPTPEERAAFREKITQRAKGVPVAYLVGKKEFYSIEFLVDKNVLIPRPETEFLVVGLFDAVKQRFGTLDAEISLLDVGTGSGILPITAGTYMKNAQITAADISPGALEVAQKNLEKHAQTLGTRVTLLESDLFAKIPEGTCFDFIVSNPPYVGKREIDAELETNVYRYEPHVALFGGETGTELIERMLPQVPKFLKPNGIFLMELSPMIHDSVLQTLRETPGLEYIQTIRDLDQQNRILTAQKARS